MGTIIYTRDGYIKRPNNLKLLIQWEAHSIICNTASHWPLTTQKSLICHMFFLVLFLGSGHFLGTWFYLANLSQGPALFSAPCRLHTAYSVEWTPLLLARDQLASEDSAWSCSVCPYSLDYPAYRHVSKTWALHLLMRPFLYILANIWYLCSLGVSASPCYIPPLKPLGDCTKLPVLQPLFVPATYKKSPQ